MQKELKVKKKQSQERRQAVLIRKQSVLAEKRQRTYLVLHRHELRLEAEAKAREILELIERKEMFEKAWFLLRDNHKVLDELFRRFEKRKAELEHAAKLARAATTIQVFFRHMINQLDRSGLSLRACRNHFLLFSRHHIRSVRATAKQRIVRVIKQAYKNSILPVAASRMLSRMALVKQVWKAYLEKRKRRWDELLELWKICMDEILAGLQKPVKGKGRTARKKKDPAVKYMEIPPGQKMQTLTSWMLNAKRRYRDQLREYINSQHDLLRKGLKAFMNMGSSLSLIALPQFRYLPSTDEMKAIINKTAGVIPTQPKK